jgi:hypothetical protein
MDCLLVTAKLIHGASLNGIVFTQRDVTLGLISALMHDTGYIQAEEDNTGTGAKYTVCHIQRSIEFMKKYFHDNAFPSEYLPICSNFLRCTGLDVKIAEIKFQSREHEILGQIVGTATLLGKWPTIIIWQNFPCSTMNLRKAGCRVIITNSIY